MKIDPTTWNRLRTHREALSERVTTEYLHVRPELLARYGTPGSDRCREDAAFHLEYLLESLRCGSFRLYADYVQWAGRLMAGLRIPPGDLREFLNILHESLIRELPPTEAPLATRFMEEALAGLTLAEHPTPSHILSHHPLGPLAQAYLETLLRLERPAASRMIMGTVQQGTPVAELYLELFQPVLREVGRLWQENRISVTQEHYCTAATQQIMAQLYPHIFRGNGTGPCFVSLCPARELHEVGVRMVSDFFELAGWRTIHLGANTPIRGVVETLREQRPRVVGIGVTLAIHLEEAERMIRTIRDCPELAGTRLLVGGMPFLVDPELWRRIGADAMGRDARDSVAVAETWLNRGTMADDAE